MALKGESRDAMYKLPDMSKKYLLQQHHETRPKHPGHKHQPSHSVSYGPSSGSTLLPRLVPQLTGDSNFFRRLSLSNWGSGDLPSYSSPSIGSNVIPHNTGFSEQTEDIQYLSPQSTGGFWSNLWSLSGGDNSKRDSTSPSWYMEPLRTLKPTDPKLAKHLISLRVHLSSADLTWIEDFLENAHGVEGFDRLIAGLVTRSGKKRNLTDAESTVLLETIKCLRALLNTEVGYPCELTTLLLINLM